MKPKHFMCETNIDFDPPYKLRKRTNSLYKDGRTIVWKHGTGKKLKSNNGNVPRLAMVGCHRLVTVQRERHPGLKGLKGQTNQPKGLKTNRQTGGDWFYWLAAIIRQNMVKNMILSRKVQSAEKLSEKWELVVRRVLSDLDWAPGSPWVPA